jgi:hypothetical protein
MSLSSGTTTATYGDTEVLVTRADTANASTVVAIGADPCVDVEALADHGIPSFLGSSRARSRPEAHRP